MAVDVSFLHKTNFYECNKHLADEFLLIMDMVPFVGSSILFICNFVVFLFGVIVIRNIFRIEGDYGGSKGTDTMEDDVSVSQSVQKTEFVEESGDFNLSKFKLEPTMEIHGFLEATEATNCVVEEFYVSTETDDGSPDQSLEVRLCSGRYSWESSSDDEAQIEEGNALEEGKESDSGNNDTGEIDEAEIVENQKDLRPRNEDISTLETKIQLLGEDYFFSSSDSDSESVSFDDDGFSQIQLISNVIQNDIEIDDHEALELEAVVSTESQKLEDNREICFNEDIKGNFFISDDDDGDDGDDDDDDDDGDEYIEFDPHIFQINVSSVTGAKILPLNDGYEEENLVEGEAVNEDNFGGSEEMACEDEDDRELKFEDDYEDEMEFLKEHQDLIQQLKMELRNTRTGGLPTIPEDEPELEAVSPMVVQGLKHLKNGGSSQYKEQLREIQKVYKTYSERMRKLDIFNNQTMHAIGFLKLTDPGSSTGERKSPIRVVKSLLSHNLWPRKTHKKSICGTPRTLKDLNIDLELVYIGHLCLSWEILHWQLRKAMKLQENDSQGTHHYNEVVNKFQLFCVLVQRFIEDERFRGPRIENYVKNRCVLQSLLQVPAIREDCSNDRKVRGKESENNISTAALVPIIEDAMTVYWEFLRNDKDLGNSTVKGAQKIHITDLQNTADAQLLMIQIRNGLQKKEKRLKDILRGENCIVKKLQRNQKSRINNGLFIAQVELKLVSRVLCMSKLTQSQLIWCHKKLHQINFVNRKVIIEPSFLLFPC